MTQKGAKGRKRMQKDMKGWKRTQKGRKGRETMQMDAKGWKRM